MKRLLTAAAIALAAGLAACATATPYQPAVPTASGPANGFYEMPLEGNRWRVGFAGNTVTSRQQVEDALLLRAAELTLQRGFDHFVAVNRATERDVSYRSSGPYSSSLGFGYGYGGYGRYGRYGGYPYWSPYWRYSRPGFGWGSFYDPFWDRDTELREIDKYEANAEIVMGRGPTPANDLRAFDARQIYANLSPRVPRPQAPQGYAPGYAPQPAAPPPAPAYPRTY